MKTAVAIRHVHFEDMGTLEPLLHQRGFAVRYFDAGVERLDSAQIQTQMAKADLLVVLGGPIGAFDEETYPFLTQELELIQQRIEARRPLLGICLGAQLMARALGAKVAPMGWKEIGFSQLTLTAAGRDSVLAALPPETQVLHWHGDQFGIPDGLESLAGTELCPHQAFALENFGLGLQFHLETDTDRLESWLIGHAAELGQAGVDPRVLRAQATEHGAALKRAAAAVFNRWLLAISPQLSVNNCGLATMD